MDVWLELMRKLWVEIGRRCVTVVSAVSWAGWALQNRFRKKSLRLRRPGTLSYSMDDVGAHAKGRRKLAINFSRRPCF